MFIGGGTNGRGHELNVEYQVSRTTRFCVSYFLNQIGLKNGKDFHRLLIDFNFIY